MYWSMQLQLKYMFYFFSSHFFTYKLWVNIKIWTVFQFAEEIYFPLFSTILYYTMFTT